MYFDRQENDSFDKQLSYFFRKGAFSVSEKELLDHFYWLRKGELQNKINALIASGKLIKVGDQYTFSFFIKTIDRLVQMIKAFQLERLEPIYSVKNINKSNLAVIHVNQHEREALLHQLIKNSQSNVLLIAQDLNVLRSFSYGHNVKLIGFSDIFRDDSQKDFISYISPNDRIIVVDGNFMTLFLFYLCVAGITKPQTFQNASLNVLVDFDFDANLFAGGFLRTLYKDMNIPLLTYSQSVRNVPNFLTDFVDGNEYFQMLYLNEALEDSKIYLSIFNQLDNAGINLVKDVVYISTVENGRFSSIQAKWVMAQLFKLSGIEIIEKEDGLVFFVGERIRAKGDAIRINYADEYEIIGFDSGNQIVNLASKIDFKSRTITYKDLEHFVSSTYIHINEIAHQNYSDGVLIMPLSGLHDINDSDLMKFVNCVRGYRLIMSQKIYIAHALSNRSVKFQNSFSEFLKNGG